VAVGILADVVLNADVGEDFVAEKRGYAVAYRVYKVLRMESLRVRCHLSE